MDQSKPTTIKCAHCQKANFAANRNCSNCKSPLYGGEGTNSLVPCPDCHHLCSLTAESCPNCGRVFKRINNQSILGLPKIILVTSGLLIIGLLFYSFLFTGKGKEKLQSLVSSGDSTKTEISTKNRKAARLALDANEEIQSITSVGTSFEQYSSAVQSAKIKYDAAMREYKPQEEYENNFVKDLDETFQCHIDAKDSWNEFLTNKDNFYAGEAVDASNSIIKKIAEKYDFVESEGSLYGKKKVLKLIWLKAQFTLERLRENPYFQK